MGISTSSMSLTVHRVAEALFNIKHQFIKFPKSETELSKTKQDFYSIKRFPKVVGAIDCTHIEILSPEKRIT